MNYQDYHLFPIISTYVHHVLSIIMYVCIEEGTNKLIFKQTKHKQTTPHFSNIQNDFKREHF